MSGNLGAQSRQVAAVTQKSEEEYQIEVEKLEQYYQQFYEIITEHKRRVSEELSEEYKEATRDATERAEDIQRSLEDISKMKDDILTSLNTTIMQADEADFRPVMNRYKANLRHHKKITEERMPS